MEGANVPASQFTQEVAAGEECLPASQAVQLPEPEAVVTKPETQLAHVL